MFWEVVESLSLRTFKNYVNVALKDVVGGRGGNGWWLDWVTLVVFTNLNDSMILNIFSTSKNIIVKDRTDKYLFRAFCL